MNYQILKKEPKITKSNNMPKYDFLIIGSGFFGSVFAREATDKGYKCLVIDKRDHIAGNCYTDNVGGIDVHKYGPHIFHTNNKRIWDYVNRFSNFDQFELNVIANYNSQLYNLPFNMWTFYQMWGVTKPEEAVEIINQQKFTGVPTNLEEYALSLVGEDIYRKLIYGYTKKQWGKEPSLLPMSIIKRLPFRFSFNNNYFNDQYQGIPSEGYTKLFENLLEGIEVSLMTDYFENRSQFDLIAKKVVYTGPIDRFYDYCFGKLDYRSLRFEEEKLDQETYQGNPTINYTDEQTPYTRIIEHKYFKKEKTSHTIITKEFPDNNNEPYYPINDEINTERYSRYKNIENSGKYLFGGRLAEYRYYDMHQVIGSALHKTDGVL